ncbi:GABA permease [Pandoraea communis]|uniref:GABA permease n=1 Tax=Pandoraea communis TaxID=2508297 RepID=A0A5E4XIP7_9BURK|nr:GABA permease [Pandoraea communis]
MVLPVLQRDAFLTLVAVLISQAFNPDSRFQFWFMVGTALMVMPPEIRRREKWNFLVKREFCR